MKNLVFVLLTGLVAIGLIGCSNNNWQEEAAERDSISEEMHRQIAEIESEISDSSESNVASQNSFSEQVLEEARKCYNLTVDYINGELSFQNAKEQIEGIIEEYKDTNILDIPEFNRIPVFFNANTDEPENEYLYNGITELQKYLYPEEQQLSQPEIESGKVLYSDGEISIAYSGTVQYEYTYSSDGLDVPKAAIVFSVTNKTGENLTLTFSDLHVNGIDSEYTTSYSVASSKDNSVEVRFDALPETVENIHANGFIMFDDYTTSDFKF